MRREHRGPGVLWKLLTLGAALLGAPAAAQIINLQPQLEVEAKDGFSGQLEGSGDWLTGNVRFLLVSGAVTGRYRTGDHLLFLTARAELGWQGGDTFLARDLEHLRYRYRLDDWLGLETFLQHDSDAFRRLALRGLWGAGPRFRLLRAEGLALAIGVAYMAELERLSEGALPDSGQQTFSHRLSTYAVFAASLTPRVTFGVTAYLQPRLDRLRDVRALAQSSLTLAITEQLSVRLSFSAVYDSEPPASLEKLDTALKSSLTLGF